MLKHNIKSKVAKKANNNNNNKNNKQRKRINKKSKPRSTPLRYNSNIAFSNTKLQNPPSQPFSYVYDVVRLTKDQANPQVIATQLYASNNPDLSANNTAALNTLPQPTHKFVFLHALLASRQYWKPFLRNIQKEIKTLPNDTTSPIIDIYIPDQTHHGDTTIFNYSNNNRIYNQDTYLVELAHNFHHFFINQVLDPKQQTEQQQQQQIGLLGHSLGARVLLLWRSILNQQQQSTTPYGLDSIPMVSLDASPATYTHNHNHLINAMLETPMNNMQTIKEHLTKCGIDQNTIAFVLQNNFSSTSIQQFNNNFVQKLFTSPTPQQQDIHLQQQVEHAVREYSTQKFNQSNINPTNHWWKADTNILTHRDKDVFIWPISEQELGQVEYQVKESQNVLFIGAKDSDRLQNPTYIQTLRQQFASSPIEILRGGHFVQMGPDAQVVAKRSVEHLILNNTSPKF